MKEVKGKYNTALVYTDVVEEKALGQIEDLCNQQFAADAKIRIMPDVHAGAGCTIGTTMTIKDKIVPNLVGVDIGCGMECVKLTQKEIDLKRLDAIIHEQIPAGFNVREKAHPYIEQTRIESLQCKRDGKIQIDRARMSLGTLGGGNHFIEANRDDDGNLYIVVHSGSRHMGLEIANYYQNLAWESINGRSKGHVQALIAQLKAEGHEKEIQKAVAELKKGVQTDIPKALAYVVGTAFDDYIFDMEIAQEYAALNRKAMIDTIVQAMELEVAEQFTTIHNYIDTDAMILRKGAVSAKNGEQLLIPINMRDGSLLCIGKGNDDWNQSAPHGAGRLMSRTAAKKKFALDAFRKEMEDVYSTTVNADTLDECPMAYKGIDDIVNNIGGTAEIKAIIKPIYNFKASDG